jgi:hypothetical protein
VLDVALAAVELVDLGDVDVEADDLEALAVEGGDERQADVAEAADGDHRLALLDLVDEDVCLGLRHVALLRWNPARPLAPGGTRCNALTWASCRPSSRTSR